VRIGMDGSFLHLPPSGTAAYIRGLHAGFVELDADIDLTLLDPDWHEPSAQFRGPLGRITCTVEAIGSDDRLKRMRWDLRGVAVKGDKQGAELLHIPHFSAPFRTRLPLVVTIHDVIPLVLPEYRASRAMRTRLAIMSRTVKRAQIILTPSHAAATDISRVLSIPASKIRVTPAAAESFYVSATDLDLARQQIKRFGISGPYVFNVGGLDVRKNLPLLIEAFANAKPALPPGTKLVIAGSAHSPNQTIFPDLEPVVTRFGLRDSVLLTGRVSEEDKLLLYQAADLYVTPSTYEGFGLTALEAMACGVPTIAANRTSLPEVAGDGGLLVEPNVASLSRAITDVLTNESLAASLRERGIERAKRFTWRRTAELTLDAYREALSNVRKG
jgi:glycosyltransferase involved in cell wall biosynthesis